MKPALASTPPVTVPPPEEGPSQRNIDTTHTAPNPNKPVTADENLQHKRGLQMPKLPHERDQSVGMTDGNPDPAMEQAYKDVERGLVDTDEGRRAHSVGNGKPVQPADPAQPGTPGPVEPDHK